MTDPVKLLLTALQAEVLREILAQVNVACQFMSYSALETRIFRQFTLPHLSYQMARERIGLSPQLAQQVIAEAAAAYELDRRMKRTLHQLVTGEQRESHKSSDCPGRSQGHSGES